VGVEPRPPGWDVNLASDQLDHPDSQITANYPGQEQNPGCQYGIPVCNPLDHPDYIYQAIVSPLS